MFCSSLAINVSVEMWSSSNSRFFSEWTNIFLLVFKRPENSRCFMIDRLLLILLTNPVPDVLTVTFVEECHAPAWLFSQETPRLHHPLHHHYFVLQGLLQESRAFSWLLPSLQRASFSILSGDFETKPERMQIVSSIYINYGWIHWN